MGEHSFSRYRCVREEGGGGNSYKRKSDFTCPLYMKEADEYFLGTLSFCESRLKL